jgi:sugar phosphate isomerase/epimerase
MSGEIDKWVGRASIGLIFAVMAAFSAADEETSATNRPFFAFQNGVHFRTTEERIEVLKELGYDGIGSANPGDLANRLKLYDKAGLKIFSIYVGGRLGSPVPPEITSAIAELKGRDTVIELFVQGNAANTDEEAVAFVQKVADSAKASGLRVVLYPHSGFYIDTLSDAVRIAEKCERENVGAMFNLCHFLKVEPESDLEAELRKAKPCLWRVSTSGADSGGRQWSELIQTLDQGTFDQARLLAALDAIDYRGPVGLQCYAIKGDARDNLKKSITAWRKLTQEGAAKVHSSDKPSPR